MNERDLSRRGFLATSASGVIAKLMGMGLPAFSAVVETAHAAQRSNKFQVLTPAVAEDLAAITERIFPSDETPGAKEAGVIYFIDAALAEQMSGQLPMVQSGVADLNQAIGGGQRFVSLAAEAQDRFLTEIENSEFFGFIWTLTMFGMFSVPSYGGNRRYVGWELLDFQGLQAAWTHPFGYYDRDINAEQTS
ncbi:MAG: gluconate 2-dehydrogenase subunit 3 family protein [Pseudomonadota bacterium]